MWLYNVIFVWQVLSYMGLQKLKTEVDQSLEPGRDHRARICFRLQGTYGKIWWISVHSSCDAELIYKRQPETIFTKSYSGTTDWEEKSICQRLHGYCFYLQLLFSFSISEPIPMDSKVCTQRFNKWIITPKSLLMLSVNNDQFNHYVILWDYTYTKSSKWLFDNIITGFRILLLVLIYGELYSVLTHF